MENNTLSHYGVRGMKWGIRRYQNKNGSLTPAGKKRYGNKEIDDLEKRSEDEARKSDFYKKKAWALEKDPSKFNEKEWSEYQRKASEHERESNRLKKEMLESSKKAVDEGRKKLQSDSDKPAKKSVKDMTDDELRTAITRLELEKRYRDLLPPEKPSAGKQIIDKVIIPAATESGKQLARDYINKVGKKALGLNEKEAESYVSRLEKDVKKLDLEKRYKDLTKPNDDLADTVQRLKNEVSKMTLTKQKERMEKEEAESAKGKEKDD